MVCPIVDYLWIEMLRDLCLIYFVDNLASLNECKLKNMVISSRFRNPRTILNNLWIMEIMLYFRTVFSHKFCSYVLELNRRSGVTVSLAVDGFRSQTLEGGYSIDLCVWRITWHGIICCEKIAQNYSAPLLFSRWHRCT